MDHYVSLFFIPLIPVKRGEAFLECDRCGAVFDEEGRPGSAGFRQRPEHACPRCGEEVAPGYKFCPYCGQRIS